MFSDQGTFGTWCCSTSRTARSWCRRTTWTRQRSCATRLPSCTGRQRQETKIGSQSKKTKTGRQRQQCHPAQGQPEEGGHLPEPPAGVREPAAASHLHWHRPSHRGIPTHSIYCADPVSGSEWGPGTTKGFDFISRPSLTQSRRFSSLQWGLTPTIIFKQKPLKFIEIVFFINWNHIIEGCRCSFRCPL